MLRWGAKCGGIWESISHLENKIAFGLRRLARNCIFTSVDFGPSGWLAIDPKGLIGERGFDFANIFTNPDLDNPVPRVAPVPEIFKQRLDIVTGMAGLDRKRLLKWIIAWCGLSMTWSLESNDRISTPLDVAKLAIAELKK